MLGNTSICEAGFLHLHHTTCMISLYACFCSYPCQILIILALVLKILLHSLRFRLSIYLGFAATVALVLLQM